MTAVRRWLCTVPAHASQTPSDLMITGMILLFSAAAGGVGGVVLHNHNTRSKDRHAQMIKVELRLDHLEQGMSEVKAGVAAFKAEMRRDMAIIKEKMMMKKK